LNKLAPVDHQEKAGSCAISGGCKGFKAGIPSSGLHHLLMGRGQHSAQTPVMHPRDNPDLLLADPYLIRLLHPQLSQDRK
jgi:hypothetical protein